MFPDIQARDLLFPGHADAHGLFQDPPEDKGRGEHKRPHRGDAQQLGAQQPGPAAVEQAVFGGEGGHALLGEQTDAQGAEHPAAEVDRGGAHRVIHLDAVEEQHREHHQHACHSPDEQGVSDGDIGAPAGDGHQPGQAAVDGHAQVRLPQQEPGGRRGGEDRRDGGGVGGHQDVHHIGGILEAHGGAGVKAEPAQPQHEQADHRQGHIVARDGPGLPVLVVLPDAGPQDEGPRQGRPAPQGVDHRIAGKVQKAQVGQPAAAPDPVAHDGVDDQGEHKGEHDKGDVLDPLCHRAGHDGGGGAAEHQLEEELPPEGYVGGQGVVVEGEVALAQDKQVLGAEEGVVAAEHQPPAQEHKAKGGHGKDDEVFREDVHGVFRPGHARFERGKPQVHEEHQDGRQKDP